ncbi:MAG: hypothetical protein KKB50_11540 [Planctomycetes bacterium]|nr:hypothetical protein [Planctomycetota bacterium]
MVESTIDLHDLNGADGPLSVERTWRNITAVRNVSDFKTVTSYRLVGAGAPSSSRSDAVGD